MVTMILAYCSNGGIGYDGGIPWNVPGDLRHFKRTTKGKQLIVGGGTKLPPLPGRQILICSRSGLSVEDAIAQCMSFGSEPMVIGGGQIYKYCIDHKLVDTIIATKIYGEYLCDTWIGDSMFDGFTVSKRDVYDGYEISTYSRD